MTNFFIPMLKFVKSLVLHMTQSDNDSPIIVYQVRCHALQLIVSLLINVYSTGAPCNLPCRGKIMLLFDKVVNSFINCGKVIF